MITSLILKIIICIYIVYVLILSILFSLYDDNKNLEKTSNQVCDLVLSYGHSFHDLSYYDLKNKTVSKRLCLVNLYLVLT